MKVIQKIRKLWQEIREGKYGTTPGEAHRAGSEIAQRKLGQMFGPRD